jgi:hypothetical protein
MCSYTQNILVTKRNNQGRTHEEIFNSAVMARSHLTGYMKGAVVKAEPHKTTNFIGFYRACRVHVFNNLAEISEPVLGADDPPVVSPLLSMLVPREVVVL